MKKSALNYLLQYLFVSKQAVKHLLYGLFGFLIISCSSSSDLSGEYKNDKESVIFNSDKSVIINFQHRGITAHGNYKIADNKVYIFDNEGKSFGTFVINGHILEAEKGSLLNNLMASSDSELESLSELDTKLLGKWSFKNGPVLEFLRGNKINFYNAVNDKPVSGTWKMSKDGNMSITISENGKTQEMSGTFNGTELQLSANGQEASFQKL
jgi:hypothetical protein